MAPRLPAHSFPQSSTKQGNFKMTKEAGYPDKTPTSKPPIENVGPYPGAQAPAAAKYGVGTSTPAGITEATEARRANQADPGRFGRKIA
jgi:hypothetical protein